MSHQSDDFNFKAPPEKGAFSYIHPPTDSNLAFFAEELKRGGLVAIPTETVYGLAALALNEKACADIFRVKGRPLIDPLIVHVNDMEMAGTLAFLPDNLYAIAKAFWPGPLTVVVPRKPVVPDLVTAGLPTVAIRMPKHPVTRKLIGLLKAPLAAPSANPFGYVSPSTAQHVSDSFGDSVPYIIDGGRCEIGLESTILDLSTKIPTVLRLGAITAEQISQVAGCEVRVAIESAANESPKAPGLLKRHYSPKVPLQLFRKSPAVELLPDEAAIVWQSRNSVQLSWKNPQYWLTENDDLEEAARNLFTLLRKIDGKGFPAVAIQWAEDRGIGLAINDRLSRAAAR